MTSVRSRFIGWVVPLRCSGSFMVMTAMPSASVAISKPRCCPLIIDSPSPHVDWPCFDDLVSPHDVHRLVIGDGRIDVCRLELDPLAHLYRRAGSERGVL